MTELGALVLAGGYGRRFQTGGKWRDKLLEVIGGKPLLLKTIEAVSEVSAEVVVATKPERAKAYSQVLGSKVKVVVDDPPTASLLAGVRSGVKEMDAEYVLLIAGDMPYVRPEVIELLLRRIGSSDVAVPLWPDGRVEPLLTIYRREHLLEIIDMLGEERERASDLIRGANEAFFISVNEIRSVDYDLRSLKSINTPEDLRVKRLEVVGRASSFSLRGHADHFRRGLKAYSEGLYLEALKAFAKEAEVYRKYKLTHLEKHAMLDVRKCSERR